jgi:hypothetical protein
MSNGTIVGPDGRPLDQATYQLGKATIPGPTNDDSLAQIHQEGFNSVDMYGQPSINPEKAIKSLWYNTTLQFLGLGQFLGHMSERIQKIEEAIKRVDKSFAPVAPPNANVADGVGAVKFGKDQSWIQVWPTPDGKYPTFKATGKGLFRMGTVELELDEGDSIEHRADGVYIKGSRVIERTLS